MRTQLRSLLILLTVMAVPHQAAAQGTRFFRVSGPAATQIVAFRQDGTLVWSNALANTNYTVQTASTLSSSANWTNYVQLSITNHVNTNQIVAFNPPIGMAFIPAGTFIMGDTDEGEGDALPVTNVFVSAFYMDVNLVSCGQWQSVYNWATNHGYKFGLVSKIHGWFEVQEVCPSYDIGLFPWLYRCGSHRHVW